MNAAAEREQVSSTYSVKKSDLPICCPRPDERTDLLHPKVFIAFDKSGRGVCPYCGAEYVIED